MFKKHRLFNSVYLLIFALNLYGLIADNQLVRMIAMPLIGMSLVFYLIIKTRIQETFQTLIFIGLVLSMAGDIQLLFTTGAEFYFLTALIATLIGYFLYSAAFFIDFKRNVNGPRAIGNILAVILVATIGVFYVAAERNMAGFQIPALLYLFALSVMIVLSGYRHKRVNRSSFKLILTGTFAFLVSDLAIGVHMFIEQEKLMMVVYLATYLIAQYLVVMGTIARKG
jgi:hypothetical protein